MENGFSATFQATADLSALLWKKAGGSICARLCPA